MMTIGDTMTLLHGDCLERMADIPDGTVDMVMTDLPYGTTACQWDSVIPFEPLWTHYRRVTKPNAAIVLTASQPFTSALVMSNPKMFKYCWVWKKSNGGGFLNANRQPLKRHEDVVVFGVGQSTYNPIKTKGEPYRCRSSAAGETTQDQTVAGWVTTNDGDRHPVTILDIPSETGLHPTQKPVALMEYLIRTYTNEGETVLDSCMGSGTTGVACHRANRRFIGIERDDHYFAVASKRIEEEMAQILMFR